MREQFSYEGVKYYFRSHIVSKINIIGMTEKKPRLVELEDALNLFLYGFRQSYCTIRGSLTFCDFRLPRGDSVIGNLPWILLQSIWYRVVVDLMRTVLPHQLEII